MNETPDFVLFLGRFHPLVVHLPIGFLFFAFLLEVYSKWKKTTLLTTAVPLALLSGTVTAAIACILGYMLSMSGDYNESALDTHFWFGIATTVIALLAWLIRIDKIKLESLKTIKANISTLTLIVILLSITGHYGGNLTHGSDYLTKYLPFGKKETKAIAKVEKIEEAVVFDHLAKPILENKCASCHSASKKKGGLSFQDSLTIFKGGKSGPTLIAGNAAKSEMIKRVLLNPNHEDFMPPEGKTPLTEEEITILQYWINNANANFSTKVSAIETPEEVLHIAEDILGIEGTKSKGTVNLPTAPIVSETVLKDIISEGFSIRELVFDSNVYEVVLPTYNKDKGSKDLNVKLNKLLKIKNNILWLSIENNGLSDSHLKTISTFENLQKLVINKNPITDRGINELEKNQNLLSLNIYDTKISKSSLTTFSKIKNLQKVYAWKTNITEKDLESFTSKDFPEVIISP